MPAAPSPLPHGAFHRRIIVIPEPGRVRVAMEDESHCMEVTVLHDGQRVIDIQPVMHRIPWSTCPGAPAKLKELVGLSLRRMNQSTGFDAKEHCTHLFDLTRLAMARALLNAPVQYDVAMPDRIDTETRAEILRDGQPLMAWDVRGWIVTGPDPFTGHALRGAPIWPQGIDDDTIEAALILRRVFMVALVREPNAARSREKTDAGFPPGSQLRKAGIVGQCFSFQDDTIDQASLLFNWRNFAERRDQLLTGYPGVRTIAEMAKAKAS